MTASNNNASSILKSLENITATSGNQSLLGGDILIANSIMQKVADTSDEFSIQKDDIYVSNIKLI